MLNYAYYLWLHIKPYTVHSPLLFRKMVRIERRFGYACSLKKTYWLFVFVSSNILQDLLLLHDFSISNLFPITLVKQSIEKWIFRFHVLHEIEFANKKKNFAE